MIEQKERLVPSVDQQYDGLMFKKLNSGGWSRCKMVLKKKYFLLFKKENQISSFLTFYFDNADKGQSFRVERRSQMVCLMQSTVFRKIPIITIVDEYQNRYELKSQGNETEPIWLQQINQRITSAVSRSNSNEKREPILLDNYEQQKKNKESSKNSEFLTNVKSNHKNTENTNFSDGTPKRKEERLKSQVFSIQNTKSIEKIISNKKQQKDQGTMTSSFKQINSSRQFEGKVEDKSKIKSQEKQEGHEESSTLFFLIQKMYSALENKHYHSQANCQKIQDKEYKEGTENISKIQGKSTLISTQPSHSWVSSGQESCIQRIQKKPFNTLSLIESGKSKESNIYGSQVYENQPSTIENQKNELIDKKEENSVRKESMHPSELGSQRRNDKVQVIQNHQVKNQSISQIIEQKSQSQQDDLFIRFLEDKESPDTLTMHKQLLNIYANEISSWMFLLKEEKHHLNIDISSQLENSFEDMFIINIMNHVSGEQFNRQSKIQTEKLATVKKIIIKLIKQNTQLRISQSEMKQKLTKRQEYNPPQLLNDHLEQNQSLNSQHDSSQSSHSSERYPLSSQHSNRGRINIGVQDSNQSQMSVFSQHPAERRQFRQLLQFWQHLDETH